MIRWLALAGIFLFLLIPADAGPYTAAGPLGGNAALNGGLIGLPNAPVGSLGNGSGGGSGNVLLLEDGSSKLLLEDGTSNLCLESGC